MITNNQGLGYAQSWQDVTASRAFGVTYYNTSGKPILVSINAASGGAITNASVDGVALPSSQVNTGYSKGLMTFIVPQNKSYIVTTGNVIDKWAEFR